MLTQKLLLRTSGGRHLGADPQFILFDTMQFDVSDIHVHVQYGRIELTTYDSDGEVSAVFLLKRGAGHMHLDADFADGVYLRIDSFAKAVTVESNDAKSVVERMRIQLPPHRAAWQPYTFGILTSISTWATAKLTCNRLSRVLERISPRDARAASKADVVEHQILDGDYGWVPDERSLNAHH